MRCDVDLAEIGVRCADPKRAVLPPDKLIEDDAEFHAHRLRRPDLVVLGLDLSVLAIAARPERA